MIPDSGVHTLGDNYYKFNSVDYPNDGYVSVLLGMPHQRINKCRGPVING